MPSLQQLTANRKNAVRSTGPRTSIGKLRSRSNAMKTGLFSQVPVIPGENQADWEGFQRSLLTDLNPQGGVEQFLAARIASLAWRIRRLTNHERAIATERVENIQEKQSELLNRLKKLDEELQQAQQNLKSEISDRNVLKLYERGPNSRIDDEQAYQVFELHGQIDPRYEIDPHDFDFLTAIGVEVPSVALDESGDGATDQIMSESCHYFDPFDVTKWTVEHLHRGTAYLGGRVGETAERVLENLHERLKDRISAARARVKQLCHQKKELEEQLSMVLDHLSALHGMGDEKELDKLARYESHLNRQFMTSLHEFQRLQAARRTGDSPVPTALDISITADSEEKDFQEEPVISESRNLKQVELIPA